MNDVKDPLEEYKIVPHYHGDIVRILFLLAGAIMVFSFPFIKDFVQVPLTVSIIAILILVIVAGFINPKQLWTAGVDFLMSAAGFVVFEYEAISNININTLFTIINQVLAVIFFFAIYFSAKTLRGFLLRK